MCRTLRDIRPAGWSSQTRLKPKLVCAQVVAWPLRSMRAPATRTGRCSESPCGEYRVPWMPLAVVVSQGRRSGRPRSGRRRSVTRNGRPVEHDIAIFVSTLSAGEIERGPGERQDVEAGPR